LSYRGVNNRLAQEKKMSSIKKQGVRPCFFKNL